MLKKLFVRVRNEKKKVEISQALLCLLAAQYHMFGELCFPICGLSRTAKEKGEAVCADARDRWMEPLELCVVG